MGGKGNEKNEKPSKYVSDHHNFSFTTIIDIASSPKFRYYLRYRTNDPKYRNSCCRSSHLIDNNITRH